MITMQLHGAKELRQRLKSLQVKAARKVVRSAVTAATRVQRKAIKAVAPVDSGAMKKSLTTQVKQYSAKGVTYGIAGPSRKDEYEVSVKLPSGAKVIKTAIPANYIHLLTYGHRIVVGGTLSRSLSLSGFTKTGQRRKTTRSAKDRTKTDMGVARGVVKPNKFLERGANASQRQSLNVFIEKMHGGIVQAWNRT